MGVDFNIEFNTGFIIRFPDDLLLQQLSDTDIEFTTDGAYSDKTTYVFISSDQETKVFYDLGELLDHYHLNKYDKNDIPEEIESMADFLVKCYQDNGRKPFTMDFCRVSKSYQEYAVMIQDKSEQAAEQINKIVMKTSSQRIERALRNARFGEFILAYHS